MRLIKAAELARQLGIAPRTMRKICKKDPALAVMNRGAYYIRLEALARLPGFDLVTAFLLPTQRWIKAVDLARSSGVPRRTIAQWCHDRPRFATRIGRVWYVDLEGLGANNEQIAGLLSDNGTKDSV